MQSLDYVKQYRNMPWIKRGMRVIVDGEEGHVAGGHSGNIAVKFPNRRRTANCHPWWQTVYYDKNNSVIADYREQKG